MKQNETIHDPSRLSTRGTLEALCAIPMVTGFEQAGAAAVRGLFAPLCDEIETDAFGNVLGRVSCGKPGAKTVLLDAHLDQIGFLVTEVLEDGFLRFTSVGGVDPRMLLGAEVEIGPERRFGVVCCMPPHLLGPGEQDKAIPIHEMYLDTGLTDARGVIPVGTPVWFPAHLSALSRDTITGPSLDDRAGAAAIAHALRKLQKEDLSVDLAILLSTQEEVTSLGATVGTFRVRPDYTIAVDVSHAKTPDAPDEFEFGGGVMIGMGPNMDRALTRALIRTARAEGMDYQIEVMEGNTGTNAWDMQIVAGGTATAILSIPLRYMHTPIETVKLSDVESVGDLIYHFLRDFDGEVRLR